MDSPCAVSLRSTWILFLFGCVISLPVDKDSGWAKNARDDSFYYPGPDGYPEKRHTSMDEETPEEGTEEPVLSDVSDLEPVHHFSSRSRYQQGRQAFFLTRYNPGEPAVGSADVSDSNKGMGKGKGWPVAGAYWGGY
ncbi:unnamed protein product [Arctogadus glacialis]